MPNLNEIVNEVNSAGSGYDVVRRKYIKELHLHTKRNVIVYYSGWLQKPPVPELIFHFQVNDADKNGFMAVIHQLVRSEGLDLILHTPGGDIAATESLVAYLRQMFGTNIRAFVPQLSMSAGTMIALSCKQIVMGKHSNLGPIDPQIGAMPAHGVLAEFKQAVEEIQSAENQQKQNAKIAVWQPIIAKYNPTLIGECQNAIKWSQEMVKEWLKTGMFEGDPAADTKAQSIVDQLGSHDLTKTHARHIPSEQLKNMGVRVESLEKDQELQDAVLAVHHSCISTLMLTPTVKIIENHMGVSHNIAVQFVQQVRQ